MITQALAEVSHLYEADETAWLEANADLIQQGRWDELDYAHLEEYLGDMVRRDRREVKSRLTTLLMHVLKWVHQPDQRSKSWHGTIIEQRQELLDLAARGEVVNFSPLSPVLGGEGLGGEGVSIPRLDMALSRGAIPSPGPSPPEYRERGEKSRGVLRHHAEAILTEAYAAAVERATAETGLAAETFPDECPYTLEQLLSADLAGE